MSMRTSGSGASLRGSDDWIERVRAASDIVEVVSQTVALKRVGRNWMGLCPFHGEKTPSFAVHPERQFYHCFSCKVGGDVFKFVQETEHLGFLEAAELLSRRAGIPVPERGAPERGTRTPLFAALEAAAESYEQWLRDPKIGAAARAHLEARGIGADVQREFRLGVVPPGWENLCQRLRSRHSEEALVGAGLAMRRESREGGRITANAAGIYDRFRNRLMVPLIAPGGQVVGFGARALAAEDQPKYLNSPETAVYHKSAFLFAQEQARRHLDPEGEIVVVEGYFDAIALHQAGVRNVVATSGTALSADQARILKRTASRVALTYDGDAAGQEAMLRSLGTLLAAGLEVWIVALPAGTDPDQLVRGGGFDAWREARESASDPVTFIQRHVLQRRGGPAGDADPRERALQVVVRLAVGVEDPIRLQLLLERAEQVFGLPESVLARAVTLQRSGQRSSRPIEAAVRRRNRTASHLEREVLQALLHAPDALETARRELSPEDFLDPECAALARILWAGSDEAGDDPVAGPLSRELLAGAVEGTDWAAVAEAGIRRLVRRRLEREYRGAQQRIRELQQQGRAGDEEALRLLQQSDDIARTIRAMNR